MAQLTWAHSANFMGQEYSPSFETGSQVVSRRDARQEWSEIFDEMYDWLSDPTLLANEDGEAPSKTMIRMAWDVAVRLENDNREAPIAVVPSGNGGFAFEWRSTTMSKGIEISPDGRLEEIIIRNGRLRSRKQLVV